jgi:hypothetical protein
MPETSPLRREGEQLTDAAQEVGVIRFVLQTSSARTAAVALLRQAVEDEPGLSHDLARELETSLYRPKHATFLFGMLRNRGERVLFVEYARNAVPQDFLKTRDSRFALFQLVAGLAPQVPGTVRPEITLEDFGVASVPVEEEGAASGVVVVTPTHVLPQTAIGGASATAYLDLLALFDALAKGEPSGDLKIGERSAKVWLHSRKGMAEPEPPPAPAKPPEPAPKPAPRTTHSITRPVGTVTKPLFDKPPEPAPAPKPEAKPEPKAETAPAPEPKPAPEPALTAVPDNFLSAYQKPPARGRTGLWVAVVLVLIAAAGGAYYWFFARGATPVVVESPVPAPPPVAQEQPAPMPETPAPPPTAAPPAPTPEPVAAKKEEPAPPPAAKPKTEPAPPPPVVAQTPPPEPPAPKPPTEEEIQARKKAALKALTGQN